MDEAQEQPQIVDLGAEPPVAVLAFNPPQGGLASSQSARDTSHSNTAPSTASGPSAPITTLAWAPSCGRSYHLIATGSLDGTVRVWRVTPAEAAPADDDAMEESRAWGAEVRAEWGRGDAGVAKVEVGLSILTSAQGLTPLPPSVEHHGHGPLRRERGRADPAVQDGVRRDVGLHGDV